jgi:hypothetical protein
MAHTAHGLHLEFNYTWSKELDFTTTGIEDGQGVNPSGSIGTPDLVNNRLNQNYGASDMPHRFVAIIVYQTPFGKGGSMALSNRAARIALGGWTVSSVISANDGFPTFITGANSGAITGRIHRIPGIPVVLPSSYQHVYDGATAVTLPCGIKVTPAKYQTLKYNACAFQGQTVTSPNGTVLADMYWYGDSANTQGDIRGPGRTNVDLTLRRQFPITERFKVDISAQATNAFNHPEYSNVHGGGLGGTNTSSAQPIGYGTGAFGSRSLATFDPRQIVLNGRITF